MRRRQLWSPCPLPSAPLALLLAFLPACGERDAAAAAALVPCLAATSDYLPIAPADEFPQGGRWLCATFRLGPGESGKVLTHVWTAVDVGDQAPPNHEIARGDLDLLERARGRLTYSQDVPLPAGTFRLDVAIDGRPWRSARLRVVPDPALPALASARELVPLVEGVHWEYGFESTPAGGAAARHAVRVEVGKDSADGTHLRFLRDGVLVHEEWWRAGAEGVSATRRRTGDGKEHVLEPPQLLLPFPAGPLRRWSYTSRDGSIRQECVAFGPRPVRGPEGEAPGYVVVILDRSGPEVVSSERHFLPRFGLVREEIVHTRGGGRVLLQTMQVRPADGTTR